MAKSKKTFKDIKKGNVLYGFHRIQQPYFLPDTYIPIKGVVFKKQKYGCQIDIEGSIIECRYVELTNELEANYSAGVDCDFCIENEHFEEKLKNITHNAKIALEKAEEQMKYLKEFTIKVRESQYPLGMG